MKKIVLQSFLASVVLFIFNYYILNMELVYALIFFVIITEMYFLLFRVIDYCLIEKEKELIWEILILVEVILLLEFIEIIFSGNGSKLVLSIFVIVLLSFFTTIFVGRKTRKKGTER